MVHDKLREITFSIDDKLTLQDVYRSGELTNEFFQMLDNSDQIPATEEIVNWIYENLSDFINIIKYRGGIIGSVFIIPTTSLIMN